MRAEVFHAGGGTDGQTDVTKPIAVFHNFSNAPKNILKYRHPRLVVKCTVHCFVYFQCICIARDTHATKHRYSHTHNYTYYYSFFILCILFHVSSMQINFCRSYTHMNISLSPTYSIFKMYLLISTGVPTCKLPTVTSQCFTKLSQLNIISVSLLSLNKQLKPDGKAPQYLQMSIK
jgi:hypothetical protein